MKRVVYRINLKVLVKGKTFVGGLQQEDGRSYMKILLPTLPSLAT